jgi:hypothetical protein
MDWILLRRPFHPADVDFRPGATTKDKAKAIGLAYVDKRIYEDRLDEVVGPENWAVEYRQLGDKGIICRLTIEGVSREDVGEFSSEDVSSFPTAVAQAFKRACSAFGLGRYLYSLPQVWAEYDADRRGFTQNGLQQLRQSVMREPITRESEKKDASKQKPSATSQPLQKQRLIDRIEELLLQAADENAEVSMPQNWKSQLSESELIALGKQLSAALKD